MKALGMTPPRQSVRRLRMVLDRSTAKLEVLLTSIILHRWRLKVKLEPSSSREPEELDCCPVAKSRWEIFLWAAFHFFQLYKTFLSKPNKQTLRHHHFSRPITNLFSIHTGYILSSSFLTTIKAGRRHGDCSLGRQRLQLQGIFKMETFALFNPHPGGL